MIKLLLLLMIISCGKEESKIHMLSEGLYNVQENINSSANANTTQIEYEITIIEMTVTSFSILNFPGTNTDTIHVKLQEDSLFIPSQKFLLNETDTVYILGKGVITDNNKLTYTYRSGSKLGVFNCTCFATKK
jgi:hypothetical protein